MGRITIVDQPDPIEPLFPDAPFRIRYSARNATEEVAPEHWDHLAIHDKVHHQVVSERWFQAAPLQAAEVYVVTLDVDPLPAGCYIVLLTLDGGSSNYEQRQYDLDIPSDEVFTLLPAD
ncbi:MAG: hypothetical protein ACRDYV_01905 [Acidimicrobiia bacterium]